MTTPAKPARLIVTQGTRPVLPRHIKLRHDAGRGVWLLLAPERVFTPDQVAVEVLKLCDGARSVEDICGVLSGEFNAPVDVIRTDIIVMLQELADKGVVKA